MAKPKQKNKRKQAQAAARGVAPQEPARRKLLTLVPYAFGGAIVLGGAGVWSVSSVRADLAEQDLSIIGDGVPTIVQIHDPSCPICTALQRETRAALAMLPEGTLEYRVANITSDVGSVFASRHNSSHATLLFFDAAGQLTYRVQGATQRDVLYDALQAHLDRES